MKKKICKYLIDTLKLVSAPKSSQQAKGSLSTSLIGATAPNNA